MKNIKIGQIVFYKDNYYVVVGTKDNLIKIIAPHKGNTKLMVSDKNVRVVPKMLPITSTDTGDYLVTPKKFIISLSTGRVMKWGNSSPIRKSIIKLSEQGNT